MRTEDIMRGDLLFYKGKLNAFPFKVEQITKKKIGYHIYQHRLEWVRQGLLEPIPLTDEFLSKNFERNGEYGFQLGNLWRIWSNTNYGYIAATLTIDDWGGGCYEPCIPCRYVHELQNLLKQLKINKEITL